MVVLLRNTAAAVAALTTRPSIWQKREKKRENRYHLSQCQKLHEDDFEMVNSKTTIQVSYEKWLMHNLYSRIYKGRIDRDSYYTM